jgi:tetratricopeptide (TPR) repeat protein
VSTADLQNVMLSARSRLGQIAIIRTLFPASLLLLLSFLLPVLVYPQARSGSVSIRVSDADTEVPVAHADVRLYVFGQGNFSYQAFADAGGHVLFGIVNAGQYTVSASVYDHEPSQELIDVAVGETSYVLVRLKRKTTSAAPVPSSPRAVSSAALGIPEPARKEFEVGSSTIETNPEGSIVHFRTAAELYPKYAEAYLMIAIASLKLGRRSDAVHAIDQAISRDPTFSRAHTLKGRMLLESRDFPKAEQSLKESLRLDPNAWDAHFELARCYFNVGQIDNALDSARHARDLPDASPLTHLLLSDILLKKGLKQEAMDELRTFLKIAPSSPFVPRVKEKLLRLESSS